MSNPVDDVAYTRPMIKALRGHVDAFAESMAGARSAHGALERVRPCAVAWVYFSTLVAWAEDHGLVDPWLRAEAKGRRELYAPPQAGGMLGWLARAYASLCVHPATWCLLDPRYSQLREHDPSEQVCRDLVDWWTGDAPSLAYETTTGPASISGWIVGDLLQALSTERVKAFAFAQTPWWVADGITDLTLIPACDEFRDEPVVRTIDATCGTGHFLVRKIDYLWEWYTTGEVHPRQMQPGGEPDSRVRPATGGPRLEPAEAIRRIIAGVDGCEIDPLTAAVARLRVVVAIGELMHRSALIPALRLDGIPPFQPRIVVGDSLLAGRISAAEYAKVHPELAEITNLGIPDERSARSVQLAIGGGT
ncbi:hypothetical protein DP939_02230 [Spongiactinospora rosea]|uniref:Uncharacterized protein n=1 Tax=Spongiactinospora rosea TaxID=2248750 RepID=A0A366M5L0_9ACTN|nr:hypothetical protein [Spongiactinospora rosea]RBQ21548.1 hypothetical protein DP939_02230 [Spongiactinospora rosea]